MKDLGKAFTFIFKDPRWVSKVAVAALFMILSIVLIGFIVLVGYFIQLIQRVIRREEYPLPDWSDIGVKFIVGIKFAIVYLVYLLPVLLLAIPIMVIAVTAALTDQPDLMGALMAVYMFGFTLLRPHLAKNGLVQIAEGLDLRALLDGAQGVSAALVAAADQGQRDAVVGAAGAPVQQQKRAGGSTAGIGGKGSAGLHDAH